MTQQTEKRTYKKTLNLPKTSFSMKANLVQNEPASMKRWDKLKLYEKLREAEHPKGRYAFHDGPPYANGSIHLGHLLNKVLKDLVVRTKTMAGYDVPYTPGWDCHGLPIEHKVMQEAQEKDGAQGGSPAPGDVNENAPQPNVKDAERMAVRRACKKYAQKYIKLQAKQMQRLLTVADYDNPYLTMVPGYEGAVLDVFADLVGKGLVYRMKKPVHWSIDNQTALADAELEYYDREDTSVYVEFELSDPDQLPCDHKVEHAALMIWTTTPWTLPANLAVAVHADHEYGLYRAQDTGKVEHVIVARDLAKKALRTDEDEPLATFRGTDLVGLRYTHPFIDDGDHRQVVAADYVTLEDGTGLVHTAPGHGVEDYQTGLKHGLDIYCPVRNDGTFDDTAPEWLRGKSVWEANDLVVERLRGSGHLYFDHKFNHSYPHDWRGKSPVIFRATEQWFVDVNKPIEGGGSLQQRALDVTANDVKFYPEWGRNRMRGMLETRPDWCLSRQRAWGLPIPAFFGPEPDQYLLTRASVSAVADKVREHGSDAWFKAPPEVLLENYDVNNDPDAPDWLNADRPGDLSPQASVDFRSQLTKAHDIFDVWFESGSSWNAALKRMQGDYPADLYLEGSDQHRGWFQLSLLPGVGVTGQSPFKSVLTHGFMVDRHGKKMSKSDGNALNVDDLLKDYGADVCRWWVSSLNTDNDIKVDPEYFKVAGEEYRKVRNTLRFILSNLGDFDMHTQKVRFEDEDATSIDAWATRASVELSDTVLAAFESFAFRKAHEAIHNFCNDTMSAVYLAAVKDRLYCDAPDSRRRRRTQATLYRVATTLIRLLAPILPHTADEAWAALEGEGAKCVHLMKFHDVTCTKQIPVDVRWPKVLELRDTWMRALEQFRQSNDVDNPLDLGLCVPDALEGFDTTDLADLCGISRFETGADVDGPTVVDLRDEPRCERSWKRDGTVQVRSDGGSLCDRCAAAVGV